MKQTLGANGVTAAPASGPAGRMSGLRVAVAANAGGWVSTISDGGPAPAHRALGGAPLAVRSSEPAGGAGEGDPRCRPGRVAAPRRRWVLSAIATARALCRPFIFLFASALCRASAARRPPPDCGPDQQPGGGHVAPPRPRRRAAAVRGARGAGRRPGRRGVRPAQGVPGLWLHRRCASRPRARPCACGAPRARTGAARAGLSGVGARRSAAPDAPPRSRAHAPHTYPRPPPLCPLRRRPRNPGGAL